MVWGYFERTNNKGMIGVECDSCRGNINVDYGSIGGN